MEAASTLQPGHIVAGRYRVERQIGEGGVGSVYLVRHVHTDEALALKILQTHALRDAGAVERFRREARAPARIASEHVTRVSDADTAPDLDNAPFLVMELLRGRELNQVIAEQGPLAPALVVDLLKQASRALDKAHGLGIVHRDLKPDNLFLTEREDGTPCIKLLDFGIARIADAPAGDMKTQAGLVFGTPGYMAPEQMTGEVDRITPATDVWALGLVAFYLLVGRDFWASESLTKLYATILTGPIVPPSEKGASFGPAFDAWFARCVAREPGERFQTAGEAAAGLQSALGLSSSIIPDSVVAPPRKLPPMPVLAAAGGGVLLLLVLGLFFGLRSSPGEGTEATVASSAATAAQSGSLPGQRGASAVPPSSAALAATGLEMPAPVPEPVEPVAAQAVAPPREVAPPRAAAAARPALRRDQRDRLDALQRLCDQGTVTAAECAAKRSAILRGDP